MYVVILAGGSGTRLWPLSREQFPKQYLSLYHEKQTLFQDAINRAWAVVPTNRIIIVTHQDQAETVKHHLAEMKIKDATLLLEPVARNTAPAIGLAAWYLRKTVGPNTIMAVLPADHLIPVRKRFVALMLHAQLVAHDYGLVTFGIRPDYPETGYGYIYCGKELDLLDVYPVEKFVEKPDLAKAKEYIQDSRFLWNSGMFMFQVDKLTSQYRRHLPDLSTSLDKIDYKTFSNLATAYQGMSSVSIDYGLLEKSEQVTVISTDIPWSDMGSWEAFYKMSSKDTAGNYIQGNVVSVDTKQSLIISRSRSRLVTTTGIEDLVIVDTDDALLVCSQEKSQGVKKIVAELKRKDAQEAKVHTTVYRPWGSFTVLEEGEGHKVKRISVHPGKRLSLQSHQHRSEHWVAVKGEAKVTVDTKIILLKTGQHIFIPAQAHHRMENSSKELLEIIEVQTGTYLGEDDIQRYEDDYGRTGQTEKKTGIDKTAEFYRHYTEWLSFTGLDIETKQELEAMQGDQAAIEERFTTELAFGTGGLRGIIGAGLNRMNIYVVRKATQCLANYVNEQHWSAKAGGKENQPAVAIAYDTRHYSREFAEAAALVLAANGIKAFIFDNPRPTPQLSFVLRELGCAAGIVITASHNPSPYNGYKVYDPDGGQAVAPMVDYLTEAMSLLDIFREVRTISREEAENKGLLEVISAQLDHLYLKKVCSLSLSNPKQKLRVVFSALHGTGACFIPQLLQETDYIDLKLVEEQMQPDGSFPTVKVPNPEEPETLSLALNLAKEYQADLVMATDPDADRLGCAVRDEDGSYNLLTGNQMGALLVNYILELKQERKELPADGIIAKTIVTGDLGKMVAASYGVKTVETLTGFKYIGEKIKEYEAKGTSTFLFGYEESYGYLAGTFVRDKDAMIAALLIAEMTAYYQEKGKNLIQILETLSQKHGYYQETLVSVPLKNSAEKNKLTQLFDKYPPQVAGMKLLEKRDYFQRKSWDITTTDHVFKEDLTLPRSEVLYYKYAGGSWFCVRPSGTEPKVKIYFSVVGKNKQEASNKLARLKEAVLSILEKKE